MLDRRRFLAALGSSSALLLTSGARGTQADKPNLAGDSDRPEYHFLPPHNWMNDPNGPIWWKGKYHLFYQMNPHAAVWGDMHWGHATSVDMVHWRHLPIALAPTPGGPDSEGCFTGSAVVHDGVPTLLYTGVQNAAGDAVTLGDGSSKLRETQLLAIAEDDELMHWKKVTEPVIAAPPKGMSVAGFRDPCPWREGGEWYTGIGSGVRGQGGMVLLYRSKDMRTWEYMHPLAEGRMSGGADSNPVSTGEMWECPEFFALNGKHCLLYSTEGKVYWTTGDYDEHEHRYTATRTGVLDHGAYYAPKSFVAPDGRRILWGWIRETRPEADYARAGWAGMMSLPRVLSVDSHGQLKMSVAAEVEKLRSGPKEQFTVKPGTLFRRGLPTLRYEFAVTVRRSLEKITLRHLVDGATAWELVFDVAGNTIQSGEKSFPYSAPSAPGPDLRIFLDSSVIETIAGAREALTSRVYTLRPGATELEITVAGDGFADIEAWPLYPISHNRLTA